MDDADIAGDRIDAERERMIAQARKSQPEAVATGACLFCGDPVEDQMRWCSPECRDDWECRR
ncbi:hypothetical protein SAMN05216302_102135 [Nitrosomonas aestuarii]|uniref:Phage/conjugal plasmid C-4 type zinc finger protein, TraR family n=1 Tax=Nitrosomonas aestuarii TaxID=52441 RepID=A0A1I4DGF6_9PROT|nr:hypothetical protein SAMN05216302_102135 [Nitrosomonas aestuarii]